MIINFFLLVSLKLIIYNARKKGLIINYMQQIIYYSAYTTNNFLNIPGAEK